MGILWPVVDVSLEEAALFFRLWISCRVASIRLRGIVIVVCPFCEVVRKLQASRVRGSVFKINDDELLVFILRLE